MVILSFNVSALAVASDYLKDKTLLLEDGTSKFYGIRLQNSGSEEIQIQLTYTSTVARVVDYQEIYTVPPNSNRPILFKISAPPGSKPGDVFRLGYTINELSPPAGGGIPFLIKISKNIKVKIIEDPDKFYPNYDYVAYGAIILAFILYIYRKKIMSLFKRK